LICFYKNSQLNIINYTQVRITPEPGKEPEGMSAGNRGADRRIQQILQTPSGEYHPLPAPCYTGTGGSDTDHPAGHIAASTKEKGKSHNFSCLFAE